MPRLAGKVAFITGGGTGIGRACALLFAREGARAAIAGRRKHLLDDVAREIEAAGCTALAIACDVSEVHSIENALSATRDHFGGLNILVNNAGALKVGSVEDTSLEEWNQILAVNLTGTFLVSRAALPLLRQAGGGSIVNIGSIYGLIGMKHRAAYAASKGGVTLLTKAMALDHALEGIRVNCICPAITDTEMVRGMLSKMPDPEATRKMRAEQLPLRRLGTPEDVANLALFLASDESSWMTGAAVPIDGGFSAG
jgi:NAD(P)-dependent dehydrogenase (short-subunit alcohol dehydrogenase family)